MEVESQPAQIEDLRSFVFEEIFRVLGVRTHPTLRKLLTPVFRQPAQSFAQLVADLDELVSQGGLNWALGEILSRFVDKVEARGADEIPVEGPLLLTSNHPGAYDALVVASNLPRNDLKVIVSEVPILQNLPYTRRQLIYTPDDAHGRIAAVRDMIRHLDRGGSLLIFPRGNVEPDPAVMEGAAEELKAWSPSLELMLRKVPDTQVVTAIVSGVISPKSLRHPLTWARRGRIPRQKIAMFVQLLQQLLFSKEFDLTPKVTFGRPLLAEKLSSLGAAERMALLVAEAQQVLALHKEQFYQSKESPVGI